MGGSAEINVKEANKIKSFENIELNAATIDSTLINGRHSRPDNFIPYHRFDVSEIKNFRYENWATTVWNSKKVILLSTKSLIYFQYRVGCIWIPTRNWNQRSLCDSLRAWWVSRWYTQSATLVSTAWRNCKNWPRENQWWFKWFIFHAPLDPRKQAVSKNSGELFFSTKLSNSRGIFVRAEEFDSYAIVQYGTSGM